MVAANRQRLFIALPLLPDLAQQLCQGVAQYGNEDFGRWMAERNLHITLAFLGDQDDSDAIVEVMEQCEFDRCFSLDFAANSFAPLVIARPNVWAYQPQPNERLMRLQQCLVDQLAATGLILPKEKYLPHITLLRGDSQRPLPTLSEQIDGFAVGVNRLVLYRSCREALPDGGEWLHYEPLYSRYLSV